MSDDGLRKAAVLLMSLDEDDAAKLLSKLPNKAVEKVTIAIAQMETVTSREQERVIAEFLDDALNDLRLLAG